MKGILFAAWGLIGSISILLGAEARVQEWKAVEEAIEKGLPRTAITNLQSIIPKATRDKAWPEVVRATTLAIALDGDIQGGKPEERIVRLEAALEKAPAESKPVMQTILAHWYWSYFRQNRWRFQQRTQTAQAPGQDFTSWDLPRLFAEIDKHFQAALTHEDLLKNTAVTNWARLLEEGTMPDNLRPTMFDFIAHQALEFYTAGEQAAGRSLGAFRLLANSPALGTVQEFLSWQPDAEPAIFSPDLRALGIYQELLRFHRNDPEPRPAFADADLARLQWAGNSSSGEERFPRYREGLERFTREHPEVAITAVAYERLGRLLQNQNELVAARAAAQRGAEIFPDSIGGALCRNLIRQIEQPQLSLSTERVWMCSPAKDLCPEMNLHYRNLEKLFFRIYKVDWRESLLQQGDWNKRRQHRENVLRSKPVLEWMAEVPPTRDYKMTNTFLPAPADKLEPGYYVIAASAGPEFDDKKLPVFSTDVWVSTLGLVVHNRRDAVAGIVVDGITGNPIPDAEVTLWKMDNRSRRLLEEKKLKTDELGSFRHEASEAGSFLVHASHGAQEISTEDARWVNPSQTEEVPSHLRTMFFTDRALYRPGQTIHYKGILAEVDPTRDLYHVKSNALVTVVFYDPNGKEIEKQQKRANDFGSFSGSFIAPRDRLMGRMLIRDEARPESGISIAVEEYKRPKFEVALPPPPKAPKLNETVVLEGTAMGYSGATIDGAAVSYRVVRTVRMPWWYWNWGGLPDEEIAHGVTRTDNQGQYRIEFVAKPDPDVHPTNQPIFQFRVNADVTDSAGETRSAERVIKVGYTALEAYLTSTGWQVTDEPVKLSISTQTLDGEPQVAEGSVRVFALLQPTQVQQPPLSGIRSGTKDLTDLRNWEKGAPVGELGFTTSTNGTAEVAFKLGAGPYRAELETQDRFGNKVTGFITFHVIDPAADKLNLKVPYLVTSPDYHLQPGEEFLAIWGTGYDSGRAFIEVEHRDQIVRRYWTDPDRTQQKIQLPITEEMRGGLILHVTQVRDNRAHLGTYQVHVPWENKELELSWSRFVSKLKPGSQETWTLTVRPKQPPNKKAGTEFVATLYDASLDAFLRHSWPSSFPYFYQEHSLAGKQFVNENQHLGQVWGSWPHNLEPVQVSYRDFPAQIVQEVWTRLGIYPSRGMRARTASIPASAPAPMASVALGETEALYSRSLDLSDARELKSEAAMGGLAGADAEDSVDLSQVTARKNLAETAFFYPHLVADSNGVISLSFTMPEALTRWAFLGFAHDRELRAGFLDGEAVTSKDLMVQPNPPRFLREGDTVEFTVKISNQSEKPQAGKVKLTFSNAALSEDASVDALLENKEPEQSFEIPPKKSRTYAWRISIPDGPGVLIYKAVAATSTLSDGEEGFIPVLSRRILLTESITLPIRGPGVREFTFAKLAQSAKSRSLEHQSYTVQMVSNPAWYAVLALPYLMEFPYECSEQVFNRIYANALARHIAGSDPRIEQIFDQWRNTPTLESPLEKNQDLKSVMLEETPWLRDALKESEARKNIGVLFDENRLNSEIPLALKKLSEAQMEDGAWPWFPGGPANDYITLYITTGFGRLRHLGIDLDVSPAVRSLNRLDAYMAGRYEWIQKQPHPEAYVPTHLDALYLYGRSFFLKDQGIAREHRQAVDYFLQQSRKFWLQTNSRQSQGHLALALRRFAGTDRKSDSTPAAILSSLRQRAVQTEELGMFWRDTEFSWWWYHAPIETHALMIEAFAEIAEDPKVVEELKVWLLKQKQTQNWRTTKATADAVYALLLRGRELLASDALVQLSVGGKNLTPAPLGTASNQKRRNAEPAEAGTGFYQVKFAGEEVKPALAKIRIRKTDPGVAWGSAHWQYLEDLSKVTPHQGTPLKLTKRLFVKKNTVSGPVLEAVRGSVNVGDELVVRIELRVDRDLEYVHLKDQRGSGTEPVNVLSRYKYQDGLGYYESTRDTASHFFIDYLPKGTYVFEYSTRVQLRGEYQTGVAEIQCMYAPEFNSHSQSISLKVQ